MSPHQPTPNPYIHTSAFAPANIIIEGLGYVDISIKFGLKICQFLHEQLSPSVTLIIESRSPEPQQLICLP